MKISTSLNLYGKFIDKYKCQYEKIIDRAVRCGFQYFDFNCCDYQNGDTFYTAENWRQNIQRIRDYVKEKGVYLTQSHVHMFIKEKLEDHALILKSIEAAGIAEIPWTVMHPWQYPGETWEECLEKNYLRFVPYVEFARKQNVGIAIENMPQKMYWYGEEVVAHQFYCADDLIALVDRLNADYGNVGVCWDTGHAHLSPIKQKEELLKLGKRLKVTHIADNNGQQDEHLAPFYGYVDFKEIIEALKAIDYQGTFNFETHNFTNRLPDELLDDGVKLLYKIGEYICGEGL